MAPLLWRCSSVEDCNLSTAKHNPGPRSFDRGNSPCALKQCLPSRACRVVKKALARTVIEGNQFRGLRLYTFRYTHAPREGANPSRASQGVSDASKIQGRGTLKYSINPLVRIYRVVSAS